jgi:hypothetical protein
MTNNTSGGRWGGRWVVAALSAALATSAGGVLRASDGDGRPRLAGAWTVQVTLRDCTSNAPMGAVSSLVTFHHGGTLSEDAANQAFAPGQRTGGHGAWTHVGVRSYRQRMINVIAFDTPANLPGTPTFDPTARITPGFFAGWQVVTHTVQLVDADHLTSAGTNQFYKTDGTLYRAGCSTATGTRFQ